MNKYTGRKVAAGAALSGVGAAAGAHIGKLASATKQVTQMVNVPDVYGNGPGVNVPHIVNIANDAAGQLAGTRTGAVLGAIGGLATAAGLYHVMNKKQFKG